LTLSVPLHLLLATQPPEFYWFEAFEMIRKFLLTGAPLLTRLAGIGNGAMKPSDGSEIFIALAVIAPAAALIDGHLGLRHH
jgi:hypothetical protein